MEAAAGELKNREVVGAVAALWFKKRVPLLSSSWDDDLMVMMNFDVCVEKGENDFEG